MKERNRRKDGSGWGRSRTDGQRRYSRTVPVELCLAANWVREAVPCRGHQQRLLDSPEVFPNRPVMVLRSDTELTDALDGKRCVPVNRSIKMRFRAVTGEQPTLQIRPAAQRSRFSPLRPLPLSCNLPVPRLGLQGCGLSAGLVAT